MYTGKSQSLGIKAGGPGKNEWAELAVIKSPKICSVSVGHEGQHAVLLADDAAVYFVGTAKKGEDGDSQVGKISASKKWVRCRRFRSGVSLR